MSFFNPTRSVGIAPAATAGLSGKAIAGAIAGLVGFFMSLGYDYSIQDKLASVDTRSINNTLRVYGWLAAGLVASYMSAGIFASRILPRITPGFSTLVGVFGAYVAANVCLNGVFYSPESFKPVLFLSASSLIGMMYSPVFMFVSPKILLHVFLLTSSLFAGLSVSSLFIPNEKVNSVQSYFRAGFLIVFASAIGSMVFPGIKVLEQIYFYLGSVVFSYMIIMSCQRMNESSRYSIRYGLPFQPIDHATTMYVSFMNLMNLILNWIRRNQRK